MPLRVSPSERTILRREWFQRRSAATVRFAFDWLEAETIERASTRRIGPHGVDMKLTSSSTTDGERDAPLVFISYSRRDRAQADPLAEALAALGVQVWIDRTDIPFTADFLAEIEEAIARCSLFAFLMSASSLTSRMCQIELDHAKALGKRIAPVLLQDSAMLPSIPDALAPLNFIPLMEDPVATARVIEQAVSFDQAYLHRHTWLVLRARRWRAQGQRRNDLLRSSELSEAERWLANSSSHEPRPTEAQCELIARSRRAATLRHVVTAAGTVILFAGVVFGVHLRQLAESRGAAERLAATSKQIDADLDGQSQSDALAKVRSAARESMQRFGLLLPSVKGTLLRTLARSLEIARWEHPGPQIQDLRADHRGARILAAYRGASDDNTYRVGDPLIGVANVDALSAWEIIEATIAADRIDLCPSGECVMLKDGDGRILSVLDAKGRSVPLHLLAHERAVAVDLSPTESTLVVASESNLTGVVALPEGRVATRIHLRDKPRSVTLQPGGADRCLIVFASGRAAVVDLRSGRLRSLHDLALGGGAPFAFSRDGGIVYWAQAGGELMRYTIEESRSELVARVGRQRIARIVTDAGSGNIVATTDTEGLAWVVSPKGDALLAGPVYVGVQPSVALGAGGAQLIAVSYLDATVRTIDIARQATRIARTHLQKAVTSMSFCGGHGPLLVVEESGQVSILDRRGQMTTAQWWIPTAGALEAYCDDANHVVVLSGGIVRSYSTTDGAFREQWAAPAGASFTAVTIGDRGSFYAAADTTVYRLDEGGAVTKVAAVDTDDVHRIAVDEAQDRFMVGSSGAGHIQVGRISSGAMLGPPVRAHLGLVMDLAAAPLGERFASVGTLGTGPLTPLSLWSLDGTRVAGNAAHLPIATTVAMDPAGRFLVTGGTDGKVRMWDQALLQLGFDLATHDQIVTAVAVSADGLVATAGSDGGLEIHDVGDGRLLEMVESLDEARARQGRR